MKARHLDHWTNGARRRQRESNSRFRVEGPADWPLSDGVVEVPPRVGLGFALLQSASFPEGWDRGSRAGARTRNSWLTASRDAVSLPWNKMEPRDGVEPSTLRYKGSAGAGRRGVVRDRGVDPRPRRFRAGRAGRSVPSAVRAQGVDPRWRASKAHALAGGARSYGARRGSRTRLSRFGRPVPLPLGQTRDGAPGGT